ncbi:MAG: TetR family transcriptional regulator [Myxococcota bacterium]|nr:TetR family transcriptional regulator [Myxococcota bacterium]
MTTTNTRTGRTATGKANTGKATAATTSGENTSKKAARRGPYSAGVRRRKELLEAALRIVAEEGAAAVTHRAVAKEAGTSLGPTTYHFESKEDMVREAMRYFTAKGLSRMEELAQAVQALGRLDLDQAVDIIVDVVLAELKAGETSTELQLILAISREPSFAPEYAEYQRRIEVYLHWMLTHLGSLHPKHDTRIVLNYGRGFAMEQLSRPRVPLDRSKFREEVDYLLKSLLMR